MQILNGKGRKYIICSQISVDNSIADQIQIKNIE